MFGLLLPFIALSARLLNIAPNWLPVKGLDTDPLGQHQPALRLWLLQFQPNLYILHTPSAWMRRDRRDERQISRPSLHTMYSFPGWMTNAGPRSGRLMLSTLASRSRRFNSPA